MGNSLLKKIILSPKFYKWLFGIKKNFLLLLPIAALFFNINVYAQKRTITGKVTDQSRTPLSGVSVVVKGTKIGTTTGNDGNFALSLPNDAKALVFTYVGMRPEEVAVTNQPVYNLALAEEGARLNEVVAIGYGTVRKKDLTGAVSVVKTEDIKNRTSTDLAGLLKGLASGVKVTSSGLAGASSAITIRGIGNLTNNNPLYVIDGFPSDGGMNLNVADIQSVQILKDASSAAIYGSRAANGVILITTKQGVNGPLKVNFSSQASIEKLPRYDLMNRAEYIKYDDMAYDEAIRLGLATTRQNHFDGNTDWQDVLLKTALVQNHNVSFSGGNNVGKFFVSLNYLSNSGTLYNTLYDRLAFRVNTSAKKGFFSFGENLYIIKSKQDGIKDNPFANLISMPPTIPVYDTNHQPGGFGYGEPDRANTYALNPIGRQELDSEIGRQTLLKGNIFGQIDFSDAFAYKLNFGYSTTAGITQNLRKSGRWTMGQANDPAYLSKSMSANQTVLVENTLSFHKQIGNHLIDAVAGTSYQHDNGEDVGATKLNPLVVNDMYYTALNAATGITTAGGGFGEAALNSYFGRLNYSYSDKYLFSFTIRRDGSSRLPAASRWGNFPSISGAWRISKEKFFNVPFINDLKLRANYGILGNANIGYWDYLATMNTAPRAVFGNPEHLEMGTTQSRLINDDITWEKKIQTNFGLDAQFLQNKLSLSAEYFISTSKDLLVGLPVLMTTGNNGGDPIVNAASLENKGIEIDLGWRERRGDFSYNASINYTRIRNKVLSLGYGKVTNYTSLSKTEIGSPLGKFYLLKTEGIFQSLDEIKNYTNKEGKIIQPNALPGDIKYNDFDGDGNITSNDRQIVGNPWPKFEMGLILGAKWKDVDISLQGFGRFGFDIWNGSRATAGDFANNGNNFKNINPWTPKNTNTNQPRIVFGDTRNSRGDQDRWLENGTFFRFSEISIGYSLPKALLEKMNMQEGRMGMTLRNILTLTSYSGLDPDFVDSGIFTISADNAAYPNTKGVMFSLSFGF